MVADYIVECRSLIFLDRTTTCIITKLSFFIYKLRNIFFSKFQIIGAYLAYRFRNLMNPEAMANRNGGSTGADFNPHTI